MKRGGFPEPPGECKETGEYCTDNIIAKYPKVC